MVDANSAAEEIKEEAHRLDGMEVRTKVLQCGLRLESIVNKMLVELLGIREGERLPFSQYQVKIKLLILIGALEPDEKEMFDVFGEIRNQFVHSIETNTLEKCVEVTNTKKKVLAYGLEIIKEKGLDPNTVPEEGRLQLGLAHLHTKVIKRAIKIRDLASQRRESRTFGELSYQMMEQIHPTIYGPLGEVAKKIRESDQATYTREEVYKMVQDVTIKITDDVLALVEKVVLANENKARAKKGLDLWDYLPESEISRLAKEMGH